MKQKRAIQTKLELDMPSARVYDTAVLSRSDIVINHALDVIEKWVDRYVVTPLCGRVRAAAA